MKEQLTDAWRINNRMNLLLIDNITDEGMQMTLSSRGQNSLSPISTCNPCTCELA